MGAVKFRREWMKHHLIDDRPFYSSSFGVVIAGQEAVWSGVGAIESVQLKIWASATVKFKCERMLHHLIKDRAFYSLGVLGADQLTPRSSVDRCGSR